MLALFRRKQRGLKWILWLVILGLTAGMVLLFVDTPTGVSGGIGAQDVAMVDGRPITAVEFRRHQKQLYEVYRQVYRLDQLDADTLRQLGLGQQALNQLISEYALAAEAERLGIQVTDAEVQQRIAGFPSFQEKGRFVGAALYQEILRRNELTPGEFEESVRREILRQKLQNILTDGVTVAPDEVRQEFLKRNEEIKVRYVAVDPFKITPPDPDEKQLREYFEKNQETYRVPEQRKIKYLAVKVDPASLKVTAEQIAAHLDAIPEKESVRASHILFRVENEAEETKVRQKAEDVLSKIRGGADFAQLAKEHSQDPGSAAAGGDLGFFGRGQMAPEFEQAVFALQPGQISDLVRSPFGYHIIKVSETRTVSPEERRKRAESEVRRQEAERSAQNLAGKIAHEVKGSSLQDTAQRHGLSVQETAFFALAEPVPGLSVGGEFKQKLFGLKKGEFAGPEKSGESHLVAQLADVKASALQPFEQARTRVLEDFKAQRREELAREQAFALYDQAKEADFERPAKAAGLTVTTTGFFKKDARIDDTLQYAPELHDKAFRMKVGETGPPLQVSSRYVVFQLAEKVALDEQKFEQEQSKIASDLTAQKRNSFFSAYIQNLVERLRAEKKIVINQQLVDSILG